MISFNYSLHECAMKKCKYIKGLFEYCLLLKTENTVAK